MTDDAPRQELLPRRGARDREDDRLPTETRGRGLLAPLKTLIGRVRDHLDETPGGIRRMTEKVKLHGALYAAMEKTVDSLHRLQTMEDRLNRAEEQADLDHQVARLEKQRAIERLKADIARVAKEDEHRQAELDARIAEETVKALKAKHDARQWQASAAGDPADRVSPRVREVREVLKRYMADIRTLAIDKKAILVQIEADVASGALDAETAEAMRDQIEDLIRQQCSEP